MSKYTALHIEYTDVNFLEEKLTNWLKEIHRTQYISIKRGEFPFQLYDVVFGSKPPTKLVLGITQPNWLTIHYNSFYDMSSLATNLSRELNCMVVNIMAQSVSESYFIGIHQKGECIRKLDWAGDEGQWIIQEGIPLSFENNPLGHNIAESDEKPFYFFGREDVVEYCRHLGLHLWDEDEEIDESEWTILQISKLLSLHKFFFT